MLDSRWSARMPPSWPVPSANINIVLLILAPQSIRFAWLAFAATRVSRLAAKLVHFASIVAGASAQEHEHHRDRSVICGATVSWLIVEAAPLSDRASPPRRQKDAGRSEEHTSELQSLMRISYAVFCLKKKKYILETKQKRYLITKI